MHGDINSHCRREPDEKGSLDHAKRVVGSKERTDYHNIILSGRKASSSGWGGRVEDGVVTVLRRHVGTT